jgi:hypothetical protein
MMYVLNKREHATILAALRYYQADGELAVEASKEFFSEDETPPNGLSSLTEQEIGHLCEVINTQPFRG